MVEDQACVALATMLLGDAMESVYVVTFAGVNPLTVKVVWAAFTGSLFRTITVVVPPATVAAYTLNKSGLASCVAETEIEPNVLCAPS